MAITTATTTIDPRVFKLFQALDARYQALYAEYLAACEIDRSEGHRPSHCEHGAYLWVDHDVICGDCEDGVTMRDGLQRRGCALREAKRRIAESDRIASWLAEAARLRVLDAVDVRWTMNVVADLLRPY